jgi:hypothetical protein
VQGKHKLVQAEEPNLFAHWKLVYPLRRNIFELKQEESFEGRLSRTVAVRTLG